MLKMYDRGTVYGHLRVVGNMHREARGELPLQDILPIGPMYMIKRNHEMARGKESKQLTSATLDTKVQK